MKPTIIKVLFISLISFVAFANFADVLPTYAIATGVFSKMPFIQHAAQAKFGSYLVKNVSYPEIKALKKDLERTRKLKLIDRGEAHITVITPAEYEQLKSAIDISEINKLAKNIQSIPFTVLCLGKGEKIINKKKEQVYFVVVRSEGLKDLRRAINDAYLEKGGDSTKFNPEEFFPHITVGYTKRDLHPTDGVFKDVRTCFANTDIQ